MLLHLTKKLEDITGKWILDVGTDGLDSAISNVLNITLMDVADPSHNYFIPVYDMLDEEIFDVLDKLSRIDIIGHNVWYDLKFLINKYHTKRVPVNSIVFDTMFAGTALNFPKVDIISLIHNSGVSISPESLTLAENIKSKFNEDKNYSLRQLLKEDMQSYMNYSEFCVLAVLELYKKYGSNIRINKILEADLSAIVWDLNRQITGIKINPSEFSTVQEKFKNKIALLYENFNTWAGRKVNMASPKDMRKFLFEDKKYTPEVFTGKGEPSTSLEALEAIPRDADLDNLLELKYFETLSGKFDKFIEQTDNKSRVYPESCILNFQGGSQLYPTKPDIHMSKEIKDIFVAEEGNKFISVKWLYPELTIVSKLAGCDKIRPLAQNPDNGGFGVFVHQLFGGNVDTFSVKDEENVERIVRNILKGNGESVIAYTYKVTKDKAKEYVDKFFEAFPEIKTFLDSKVGELQTEGKVTSGILNRSRVLTMGDESSPDTKMIENARTHVITSDYYDAIKLLIKKMLGQGEDSNIKLLAAYKSFLFEVPEDMSLSTIIKIMDGLLTFPEIDNLKFSYRLGTGKTWSEALNHTIEVIQ